MCGISGFISHKNFLEQLNTSLEVTSHRGPDFSRSSFFNIDDLFIGLGHNRLSILDLTASGNQPMSHDTGVWIIFNGEIYNYNELKKKYFSDLNFKSSSDTEVILELYVKFGMSFVSMISGIFAFTIFDPAEKKIFMVRDSLGVKPLYYYKKDTELFFSSEIKGIKPFLREKLEVSKQDLYEFMLNGFVYEPNTGFEGVQKVRPSNYIELNLANFDFNEIQYNYSPIIASGDDMHLILKKSINKQLVSDVPVGVFYSGGIDSTVIASSVEKPKLIFAKYSHDELSKNDEHYSKSIAEYLNLDIETVELKDDEIHDKEKLLKQVKFVAFYSEELISDYTFWSTYNLSKKASELGYKVMLSGMGGDELFAGYPRYKAVQFYKLLKIFLPVIKIFRTLNLVPNGYSKKIDRLVYFLSEKCFVTSYSSLVGYFSKKEVESLLLYFDDEQHSKYVNKLNAFLDLSSMSSLKNAMDLDKYGFLAHNLSVADKASMLASIELRVPLLDEDVALESKNYSAEDLLGITKFKKPLLAFLTKKLPGYLIERPKSGFNPPLETLINCLGRDTLKEELSSSIITRFINIADIKNVIDEHFSHKKNNTYKLWQLLYLKNWFESNEI